jgi:lipopolysaccharide transport system permease protein
MERQLGLAVRDITQSLWNFRLWFYLAWSDISLRYRRTAIGPFWMVLATAMTIICMGAVFGLLFRQPLERFFPYLATGIICWQFIAIVLSEGCGCIFDRSNIFLNMPYNFTEAVLRVVGRNLIVFAHNFLIVMLVDLWFGVSFLPGIPMFLLGVLLYIFSGTWMALLLAIACARYRDLLQLVQAILSLLFLVTPVFWKKDMLAGHDIIANINLFYHHLEIMRAPLLGQTASHYSYLVVIGVGVAGWLLTIVLFARVRGRITAWL